MSERTPRVPGVSGRFGGFPRALAERARLDRFGDVPVLLAHPDWETPAPVMLWLHGRTVSKELDPGRYLRWIRAGIAACAIDLPGHGERADADLQSPTRTLDVIEHAVGEIDRVVEALADPRFSGIFDLDRVGLGGMSAGGMVTLRRLCDPHPFSCAAVESTTGWLAEMYRAAGLDGWRGTHAPERIAEVDPMERLDSFQPIPLLVLHSESDVVVPLAGMRAFVERLGSVYAARGSSTELIEMKTWTTTGAPEEHSGFGRVGAEAKDVQVEFLSRTLRARPIAEF